MIIVMRAYPLLRHSIKVRITLATLGAFLAILWSLAWFVTNELRQNMQAQLERQQQSTLALLSAGVDQSMTKIRRDIEVAAQALAPALHLPSTHVQRQLENVSVVQQLFAGGLYVVNPQGQTIAGVPDQSVPAPPLTRPAVLAAAQQGRSEIGTVTYDPEKRTTLVALAAPIRDEQARNLGTLVGIIDFSQTGFARVITHGQYGASGGYLLIDPVQRRVIAATDPQRVMEQLPAMGVNPAIDRFLQGYNGSQVLRNPLGVEILASDQMLASIPLLVSVVIPTEEAFAPVRKMQGQLLLATALASLVAAVLVWWLLHDAMTPVFDTIKQVVHMSETPQPVQPLTVSRRDELGSLINAFNALLQRQASVQAELLRHTEMLGRTEAVANVGSWRWHVASDSVTWSDQLFRIFKLDPKRGAPPFAKQAHYYPPQDMQRLRDAVALALRDHQPYVLELRALCTDGTQRYCIAHGRVTLGPDNTVTDLYGTLQDITELKTAQATVAANENRLRALFDAALDAVIGMDEQGHITHWNKSAETIFGWRRDEAVGQLLADLIVPVSLRNAHQTGMAQYLSSGQSKVLNRRVEAMAQRRGGQTFPVELSILPFRTQDRIHFTAFITDISQRRSAVMKLQLAANVFQNAFEGITVTDASAAILDCNDSFTRITGYKREEVIGQNPRLLQSGRQDKAFYEAMWSALLNSGHWCGEIWNRRKSGEIYPEWLDISAVRDSKGITRQYVALFSDITQRKELEEQVRLLAFYDPLTTLPNRRLLQDRLGQALLSAKRKGAYGALMFLDLDNFKPLNDAQGHAAGDLLLREVAQRLQACVRQNDTVARIGGDEFVVLLTELGTVQTDAAHQALAIAEKIRLALSQVYRLAASDAGTAAIQLEHHCSGSIGVALFGDDIPVQDDPEAVMRQADSAMYQAKATGRNRVVLAQPGAATGDCGAAT